METIKSEDISTGKRSGHRRYNDSEKCYKSLRSRDKWKYENNNIESKDE